jgi:hypothetical protein
LDSVAVVGGKLVKVSGCEVNAREEPSYLVVEVVVALAEGDECSNDVIARRVPVIKWLTFVSYEREHGNMEND